MHDVTRERIVELAGRERTPLYLYEVSAIRARCRRFMDLSYEPKLIAFASMANAHPAFLDVVRGEGLGVFVNSLGHLGRAARAGFTADQTVFTASAMSDAAMAAVHASAALLNLDSVGQLRRWWTLYPQAPVGIRCNIGTLVTPRQTRAGTFIGPESRLGLSIDEIRELAGEPRVRGLHLYLGTDITDLAYFTECYGHIVRLSRLFPGLEFLDFGGGFGVPADGGDGFDFAAYEGYVTRLMHSVSRDAGRPIRLILEPGRIIGAEAAHFVCRVTDVKRRGDLQLVGVDASSAQFTRPLLYPDDARHPATLIPGDGRGDEGPPVPSSVYGCSTYSRDFLARHISLPRARVGDLVALGNAGSYCASSHTSFLGFEPAAEHFV